MKADSLFKLVDEILYTLFAWIVFYPILAVRSLRPGWALDYTHRWLGTRNDEDSTRPGVLISPVLFFITSSAILRVALRLIFEPGKYQVNLGFLDSGNQWVLLIALLKVVIIFVINAALIWVLESVLSTRQLDPTRFRFHFHLQAVTWGAFYFAYRTLLYFLTTFQLIDASQDSFVTVSVFGYLLFLQARSYLPEVDKHWTRTSGISAILLVLISTAITMLIQIQYKLATTVPFLQLAIER